MNASLYQNNLNTILLNQRPLPLHSLSIAHARIFVTRQASEDIALSGTHVLFAAEVDTQLRRGLWASPAGKCCAV